VNINHNRFPNFFIYILLTLVLVLFIWLHRFMPMRDYPEWYLQGFLFSQILKGGILPDYQVIAYSVPNAASTILLGLLNLVFTTDVSSKIFLTLYVLIFVSGSIYLINGFDSKNQSVLGYFPFLLVFNNFFFQGNINYSFSLGVLFYGMGYLIRSQHKPEKVNLWFVLILSLLIYFSHAVSYFIWLLFIIIFLLFGHKKVSHVKLILGATPSFIVLLIYTLYYLSRYCIYLEFGTSIPASFTAIFLVAIKIFCPFLHFYPFLDDSTITFMRLLGILNLGFCLGILLLGLIWLRSVLINKDENLFLPITIGIILFLSIVSPLNIAGLVRPASRLYYPAMWLIFASLSPRFNKHISISYVLRYSILGVLIIKAIYLYIIVGSVSIRLEELYNGLNNLKLDKYSIIYEGDFDYEKGFRREYSSPKFLPRISPLVVFPSYINIGAKDRISIVTSGMLIYRKKIFKSPESISQILNMEEFPNCLIIMGNRGGNYYIAQFLRGHYQIIFDHMYALVLKNRAN